MEGTLTVVAIVPSLMHITFHVQFTTSFGQHLSILVDGEAAEMSWSPGDWWSASLDVNPGAPYHYELRDGNGVIDVEAGETRTAPFGESALEIVDRWRLPDSARRSRTSALFTRSRAGRYPHGVDGSGRVTFRLLEPAVPPDAHVVVCGAGPALGDWNPDDGLRMAPAPYPWWEASADLEGAAEYKFAVIGPDGGVTWEVGLNRATPATAVSTVVHDDEIGGRPGWRGAGIAVPVFSLRSDTDVGVGQFTDLEALADWAAAVGISVIQLLPVNDTVLNHDWDDSYPYNPVSVQALHPLYVDLDAIDHAGIRTEVAEARAALNDLPEIDYLAVMEAKWRLLRAAYFNAKHALANDAEFSLFLEEERDWLVPYSAWATLRDRHGTPDFRRWGRHAIYNQERVAAMARPGSADYDELRFHWFVQYHLHRQLTSAADYARSRGVALKGDLPIGVAPESVEVWTQPNLFHVGAQTGAPPDAFAVRGQNWEFPTYNWERMAEDDFAWWRNRFTALAHYVDAYRIDHVLGFFRIWEIRQSADDGLLGHFRPSLPLSSAEIEAALGPIDVGQLIRPLATEELLAGFGEHADRVRTGLFLSTPQGLMLMPGVATQRRILRAFDLGILEDIEDPERLEIRRKLLDIAADVLLLEVGDGYQPRISWQDTEHYRRLSAEQQHAFDALAIDFFHHRHTEQWERQGRATLPAVVQATDLLACGEDLGMVPELVPRLMNEMGLLSLEIERMPKRLGEWMADPADAPYLSVVSPSTHDTTTLRMWWTEDRELTQRFWNEALRQEGPAPEDLDGGTAEAMVRRQMQSPAMLCVIPISDLLAIDEGLRRPELATERINDPANRHNKWRYRLHLSLDELAAAEGFNDRLRSIIAESHR